jgi:hypothetical protein
MRGSGCVSPGDGIGSRVDIVRGIALASKNAALIAAFEKAILPPTKGHGGDRKSVEAKAKIKSAIGTLDPEQPKRGSNDRKTIAKQLEEMINDPGGDGIGSTIEICRGIVSSPAVRGKPETIDAALIAAFEKAILPPTNTHGGDRGNQHTGGKSAKRANGTLASDEPEPEPPKRGSNDRKTIAKQLEAAGREDLANKVIARQMPAQAALRDAGLRTVKPKLTDYEEIAKRVQLMTDAQWDKLTALREKMDGRPVGTNQHSEPCGNSTSLKGAHNSTSYRLNRVREHAPDVYAEFERGELSANAAVIKSKLRKGNLSAYETVRSLVERLTEAEWQECCDLRAQDGDPAKPR